MSRAVILGIAGGSKSTFARRISAALRLPLHQLDKIGCCAAAQPAVGPAGEGALRAALENSVEIVWHE